MKRRELVAAIGLTTLLTMMAACSDSKTVGSGTTIAAEGSFSVPETVPTTDAVAATTLAGTTTSAASTTTTVVAATELVLRDLGIGPFALGDEAGPVVDGLSAELGDPIRDEARDYPLADGLGEYTTADGEIGFVAPMGRSVCWSINLCAEFGGGSVASMSFVGWTYTNDSTAALSSASGGTIGSRWSGLAALQVDEGGCYSTGSGIIDGIRVSLESTGEPFSSFDGAGNYVANVPDTADVTIIAMESGKTPTFLFGDC